MRRATGLGKAGTIMALLFAVASAAHAGGLPLLADHADPAMLPLPFGIGLTVYGQNQPYRLDSLNVAVSGISIPSKSAIDVDNRLHEADVKLDAWIYPFLNVFALAGSLDGETDVDFSHANLPLQIGRVDISYHGEVYGGGVTLAGGNERWFSSLTAIYTNTSLSGDFDSSATAWVLTPKVGLHNATGSMWIGAMYQRTDERHRGTITIPALQQLGIGAIGFDVKLAQKNAWNGVIGMEAALTRHWHLELEGGFGARDSASIGLNYRF